MQHCKLSRRPYVRATQRCRNMSSHLLITRDPVHLSVLSSYLLHCYPNFRKAIRPLCHLLPQQDDENILYSHKTLPAGRACLLDSRMESPFAFPLPFYDTRKSSSPGHRYPKLRDSTTLHLERITICCL